MLYNEKRQRRKQLYSSTLSIPLEKYNSSPNALKHQKSLKTTTFESPYIIQTLNPYSSLPQRKQALVVNREPDIPLKVSLN